MMKKFCFLALAFILIGLKANAQSDSTRPKEASTTPSPSSSNNEPAKEVFVYVEQMPEFPGGNQAMISFIQRNLVYPASAIRDTVSGKVFLRFIVSETGEITKVSVIRGVRTDLDQEAIRVVSIMPKWTPGKQNGHPVNVQFNLPITFSLK